MRGAATADVAGKGTEGPDRQARRATSLPISRAVDDSRIHIDVPCRRREHDRREAAAFQSCGGWVKGPKRYGHEMIGEASTRVRALASLALEGESSGHRRSMVWADLG